MAFCPLSAFPSLSLLLCLPRTLSTLGPLYSLGTQLETLFLHILTRLPLLFLSDLAQMTPFYRGSLLYLYPLQFIILSLLHATISSNPLTLILCLCPFLGLLLFWGIPSCSQGSLLVGLGGPDVVQGKHPTCCNIFLALRDCCGSLPSSAHTCRMLGCCGRKESPQHWEPSWEEEK